MYLKPSGLPSHCSLPTPIPDIPRQEERPHQGKGNGLLSPLASQEALGTQLIRTREILSGLLKFYDPKAG